MAWTATNTFTIAKLQPDGNEFHVSLYSTDITGCEEIIAHVTGSYHYLTKLTVRTATAMAISIGSGETASAITDIHLGPIPLDAASGIVVWRAPMNKGLKGTLSLALTIDSDTAGAIWVEAHGKTSLK